jgi:hypothetical protein
MKPYLLYVAKALGAAAVAGVGALAVGYTDDVLTTAELWFAIASAVSAGGAVFGIRNGSKPA